MNDINNVYVVVRMDVDRRLLGIYKIFKDISDANKFIDKKEFIDHDYSLLGEKIVCYGGSPINVVKGHVILSSRVAYVYSDASTIEAIEYQVY